MNAERYWLDGEGSDSTAASPTTSLFLRTVGLLRDASFRDRLLGLRQQKGILNQEEQNSWTKLKDLCDRHEVSSLFKHNATQLVGE
jgi:hypothetical protein